MNPVRDRRLAIPSAAISNDQSPSAGPVEGSTGSSATTPAAVTVTCTGTLSGRPGRDRVLRRFPNTMAAAQLKFLLTGLAHLVRELFEEILSAHERVSHDTRAMSPVTITSTSPFVTR